MPSVAFEPTTSPRERPQTYALDRAATGTGMLYLVRGGADKSLARPGRKQATATKLGIYSTYPPRNSIHFLDRCSKFCKPLKKNSNGCPSNQVSVAAMTCTLDQKWRSFNCFFSPGNRW